MTRVLCHIPPFCSSSPKISKGYLILKINYSGTKYLIKHPVVYFLSSVLTLKNSSDIYVIRHMITKIKGTQFYCGTNFLNSIDMILKVTSNFKIPYKIYLCLSQPNFLYIVIVSVSINSSLSISIKHILLIIFCNDDRDQILLGY